eukprot:2778179-Amphidinium_carterae.1
MGLGGLRGQIGISEFIAVLAIFWELGGCVLSALTRSSGFSIILPASRPLGASIYIACVLLPVPLHEALPKSRASVWLNCSRGIDSSPGMRVAHI